MAKRKKKLVLDFGYRGRLSEAEERSTRLALTLLSDIGKSIEQWRRYSKRLFKEAATPPPWFKEPKKTVIKHKK